MLTVSGRERVNLNATINAVQPPQVHLDETDYVNAQSTRRLYEKHPSHHPSKASVAHSSKGRPRDAKFPLPDRVSLELLALHKFKKRTEGKRALFKLRRVISGGYLEDCVLGKMA